MSTLDAKEVLSYLNHLGYQNITAIQLKEFMKDLKKLIKYENKHKQQDIENIQPPTATYWPCDKLIHSHLAPTEASKAKEVKPKENIVSVQIKGPRVCQKDCCHTGVSTSKETLSQQFTGIETNSKVSECVCNTQTERPKSCDIETRKSKVKFQGNALRPKKSFIIPRVAVKNYKSDPVALYHKYQQGWKAWKLPGEDNRSELRWTIRERMMGQPQILSAAPSMEVLARKRKASNRI